VAPAEVEPFVSYSKVMLFADDSGEGISGRSQIRELELCPTVIPAPIAQEEQANRSVYSIFT
jgi:hypothetical protein